MDKSKRRERMKFLLEKNKDKVKKLNDFSEMFKELLAELREDVVILSGNKSKILFSSFQSQVPFTNWGRIDSTKSKKLFKFDDMMQLADYLIPFLDEIVCVFWGNWDDPVIVVSMRKVLEHIDDIRLIGTDQWIYSPLSGIIIELFHDGIVTIYTRESFQEIVSLEDILNLYLS